MKVLWTGGEERGQAGRVHCALGWDTVGNSGCVGAAVSIGLIKMSPQINWPHQTVLLCCLYLLPIFLGKYLEVFVFF